MNTPNNRRRRASRERIERAFVELMQSRELSEITVKELCAMAKVNRTTFYANYEDVYDLSRQVLQILISEVDSLYLDEIAGGYNSNDYGKLFRHIYENQLFYKTCFKLGIGELPIRQYDVSSAEQYFGGEFIPYHIEFFRAGLNRILQLWLDGGCKESPEEMQRILNSEYQGRNMGKAKEPD